MTIRECLEELKLNENYTEKELKTSYHSLVKKYHPDHNKSSNATEKIQRINEAFDKLKKELEKTPKKKTYYKQEDLSALRREMLGEMIEKSCVTYKLTFYKHATASWNHYISEMRKLYALYSKRIDSCKTKIELETCKNQFEEEVFIQMKNFAKQFFKENPHLENREEQTFETVEEQLCFYKKLIEEYKIKKKKRLFSLLENSVEYKIAKHILGLREEDLKEFITQRVQEEMRKYTFPKKEEKEVALQVIIKMIKENDYGKIILSIFSFLKETESLSLLYQFMNVITAESRINLVLIDTIINLSAQKEEYINEKRTLKLCQNITFDKAIYLERIWNNASFFLGKLMRKNNFEKNKEVYKHLKYILEMLDLAKKGIISVDTLRYVENEMLVEYDNENTESLSALEYALNITNSCIINPDYLFVKLEENRENAFAVLHRGKKNYELFFENELGMMQKVEIENPTREKIVGYIPARTILLNAEFIGKKVGDMDILYLYKGYYLTMDIEGDIKFYKRETLDKETFEPGDESLNNPEEILYILCDRADEKYASLLEEEKEMRKKKQKE